MSEEVTTEVIKKTQKTLGKYVKKPQLTEKLLKKPPFRFLHDIVTTLIKETGFLSGLFSEEELVSENVKDKDAKIVFLNKLIEAVKAVSSSKLSVKANKIVAGLEATNTNLLLQAIAKTIDSNVDTRQYVSSLKSENKTDKIKKSNTKVEKTKTSSRVNKDDKVAVKATQKKLDTPKKSKTVSSVRKEEDSKVKSKIPSKQEEKGITKQTVDKDSPKADDNKKEKVTDKTVKKENKIKESAREESVSERKEIAVINIPQNVEDIPNMNPEEHNNNNIDKDEDKLENNKKDQEEIVNKTLIRPKSARPKSGDTTEKFKNVKQNEEIKVPDLPPAKLIHPSRPKSSLRPPSVRPSSARPGAPRLRPDSAIPMHEPIPMGAINVIVENVDSTADEEETVVIETSSVEPEPNTVVHQIELDNKGHLVEQILEQIEGDKKTDIERENNILKNREGAVKDVTQLAGIVQNLTKTANPLGKLINFLHEDIEAMHTELQLWINTKKQLYTEIRKQKKSNIESNKPLLLHLEQVNHEIKKMQLEITNINCNIVKNDTRIKELLCK